MPNSSGPLALFDIDEIKLGEKLGCGGFSNVHEVVAFQHNDSHNRRMKRKHQEARDQLARLALDGRVAIKFLKKDLLVDFEKFDAAAHDLEAEANILHRLDHPNILKIRGWASDGFNAYYKFKRHDGYFLLMDRLQQTLSNKIEEWKGLVNPAVCDEDDVKIQRGTLLERLKIARDIASALEYLHEKRYIFRDLKPENVGLDFEGNGKLFDFGLARKLPRGDMDTEFDMSGKVGTARYMAPEVSQRKLYNTKADVYSFAHVLWEMLELEKPYAGFSKEMHKQFAIEKGVRPQIDPLWPVGIQKLLARSWRSDMSRRPTMKEVRTVLEIEIAELQGGSSREFSEELRVPKEGKIKTFASRSA